MLYADRVRQRYFNWLCSLVSGNRYRGRSYILLLRKLHKMEFYGFVGNDEDRGSDGKHLRFLFAQVYMGAEARRTLDILERPCSCLEMLIGLSMRISEWLEGDDTAAQGWFWEMVENLGLIGYCDDEFMQFERPDEEVHGRVENWLERRYGRDGSGGLFPLQKPVRDQRKTEIWYQLSAYLSERRKNSEA